MMMSMSPFFNLSYWASTVSSGVESPSKRIIFLFKNSFFNSDSMRLVPMPLWIMSALWHSGQLVGTLVEKPQIWQDNWCLSACKVSGTKQRGQPACQPQLSHSVTAAVPRRLWKMSAWRLFFSASRKDCNNGFDKN